jgi:hypothetical protein
MYLVIEFFLNSNYPSLVGAAKHPILSIQPIIKPKSEVLEQPKRAEPLFSHSSSNGNLINDCKKLLDKPSASALLLSPAKLGGLNDNDTLNIKKSAANGKSNIVSNEDSGNTNNNSGSDSNIASNINYFPTKCISAS